MRLGRNFGTITQEISSKRLLLSDLLIDIDGVEIFDCAEDLTVQSISCDSRGVTPGGIFVAVKGSKADGHDFIENAIAKGAVAILCDKEFDHHKLKGVCFIKSDNVRLDFARIASRFFPKQPDNVVAVTGTNGKSSIVEFYRQICALCDVKAASMGTMGVNGVNGACIVERGLTTANPFAVHEDLALLNDEGYANVAMESSSHGLDQYRMHAVRLKAAAFCGFSRDHMDYHATMDNYVAAKLKLFGEVLPPNSLAVLNKNSDRFEEVYDLCLARGHRVITYGYGGADVNIESIEGRNFEQKVRFSYFKEDISFCTSLVGDFQIYNLLCALVLAVETSVDKEKAFKSLVDVKPVKGRMQEVDTNATMGRVFVDYAHTPDALRRVLEVLGQQTKDRLFVVFGCGGERDAGKRAMMGRVASAYADKVIVTDDNPRGEDAQKIRQQIMDFCTGDAVQVGDRVKAIKYALLKMRQDDVLLIAGKGHEKYQLVAGNRIDLDDVEIASSGFANG